MAYFSIGMALYSEGSYEDVLAQLTDGLSWASGWQEEYRPPSKSAIFQARARLGVGAVGGVVRAGGSPDRGPRRRRGCGWPGVGWSRSTGRVWMSPTRSMNAAFFGRPGVNKGEQAAFPQARVVALAECGTHAIFAAAGRGVHESEATLTEELLAGLEPGMLLLADRGFFSYALWRKAIGTGADLLWRIRTDRPARKPELPARTFPDGPGWRTYAVRPRQRPAR